MAISEITVKQFRIKKLLQKIDEGNFAIPKLQREFVWNGKTAAKLFDSIHRKMPIGLVMIWKAPKKNRLQLRQKYHILPPFNLANKEAWCLIDGQQRVSVIFNATKGLSEIGTSKGVDFKKVVFALEEQTDGQQVHYRKPSQGNYISISEIVSPAWRRKFLHLGKRKIDRISNFRKALLNYPMQLMFVRSDVTLIQETFLRINKLGTKLSSADAIMSRAVDLDVRDICHEIRQKLNSTYKEVPDEPILFSMAAIHGAKEARGRALDKAINELNNKAKKDQKFRKSLIKDWDELGKSFGRATDYLSHTFSALNRNILYSDYQIAMLALFFFWNKRGPTSSQKKQLCRWFWATSVSMRYSGQNFNKHIPDDLHFFKKLAKNENLRFQHASHIEPVDVRKTRYGDNSGISSAIYCLLLKRKPVSIMDDGLNDLPNENYASKVSRKDRHHIFPKARLNDVGIKSSDINSIVNICLLTSSENQKIGAKSPKNYLGEARGLRFFQKKMDRHLIPFNTDEGIFDRNLARGYKAFINERLKIICKELETEAGIKLFQSFG